MSQTHSCYITLIVVTHQPITNKREQEFELPWRPCRWLWFVSLSFRFCFTFPLLPLLLMLLFLLFIIVKSEVALSCTTKTLSNQFLRSNIYLFSTWLQIRLRFNLVFVFNSLLRLIAPPSYVFYQKKPPLLLGSIEWCWG